MFSANSRPEIQNKILQKKQNQFKATGGTPIPAPAL
jgi:hypothetical protein